MSIRLGDEKNLFYADGYSLKNRHEKHDWILTIHFSIKIEAYVKNDNDIIIEDNIVQDLILMEVFLVPLILFLMQRISLERGPLKKINFKTRTGAQETHELCWQKDSAE